jgi:hypothetical protein
VFATFTLATDPGQIRSATDALGHATAALAARSHAERALLPWICWAARKPASKT